MTQLYNARTWQQRCSEDMLIAPTNPRYYLTCQCHQNNILNKVLQWLQCTKQSQQTKKHAGIQQEYTIIHLLAIQFENWSC